MKRMTKKLLVVMATSLVLTSGATAALADDASQTAPPTESTTSTTTPSTIPSTKSKPNPKQKADIAKRIENLKTYKDALDKYLKERLAIEMTHRQAIKQAHDTVKTARSTATTKTERAAAQQAFNDAIGAANEARKNSLSALGPPPVKPTN